MLNVIVDTKSIN